jgi:hypothetical protein
MLSEFKAHKATVDALRMARGEPVASASLGTAQTQSPSPSQDEAAPLQSP